VIIRSKSFMPLLSLSRLWLPLSAISTVCPFCTRKRVVTLRMEGESSVRRMRRGGRPERGVLRERGVRVRFDIEVEER
jgi:hypothetical protein